MTDAQREAHRRYRERNRAKLSERQRELRRASGVAALEYHANWRRRNREAFNAYHREYRRSRPIREAIAEIHAVCAVAGEWKKRPF